MQSMEELRRDFLAYANSQNLEGVAVEKLCNLLAYSAYKNQVLQASNTLEASFVTSTKLNSRIHHAANYQYSVPRGRCPILTVQNIKSIQTTHYNYLDYMMTFNGYYFYLSTPIGKDVYSDEIVQDGVSMLCSSYQLGSAEVDTDDSVYFVDFSTIENASSDYILYLGNTKVDPSLITEDSSLFYYKDLRDGEEEYKYKYDYLVLTIPSFGVRVIRHSNTTTWGDSKLRIEYIPYNETTPDFTALRSIPGFTLIEEESQDLYTELTVIPFEERLTDLDTIYANAVSSYLQQATVATPYDLLIWLKKEVSSTGYYRVYNDVKIYKDDSDNIIVNQDSTYATVIYSNVLNEDLITLAIQSFVSSFSVTKNIAYLKAVEKKYEDPQTHEEIKFQVVAYSTDKVLDNDMLVNLTQSYQSRIGETLNHSQFEADLVRLGFDYVKVYEEGTDTETDFNLVCEQYEYPSISATVRNV